ncbi:cobalt ABC transporter permease [Psychromonas sp. RZ22]|uniref:cobalt ABC transporter permease n=1 Tax=Psychromonas algarum TaxID=2555643 RepID=UPI0010685C94|nr:cobalt ABC transporter permease [Psychromonas sp. RZ22]TEW56539.1 cobalt ABC transporter permease [Psychromonas sp. RZ22]
MKSRSLFLVFVFACSLFSFNAFAHNVVGGVYANGFEIEGEAGFSNGSMARAGTIVKVSDQSGTPLGEVKTDADGLFTFTAKKRITHVFKVNMGAGHLLTMQLPAEELPDDFGHVEATTNEETANEVVSISKSNLNEVALSSQITPLMLEKAIAKEIIPLRKEIQALKEKSGLRDILGGIGYIFGLLGLVVFLRERKLKAKK